MSRELLKQALSELERYQVKRQDFERFADLITAIRAHLANTKDVEPVAVTLGEPISDPCGDEQYWLDSIHSRIPIPEGTLLYLHPAPIPPGWLRAVDEAMVGSHLGVADASNSYEVAKKKLNDLICWNIDVATDPAVNGGMVLVPEEPTEAMIRAGAMKWSTIDGYKAMLAAAIRSQK